MENGRNWRGLGWIGLEFLRKKWDEARFSQIIEVSRMHEKRKTIEMSGRIENFELIHWGKKGLELWVEC